MGEALGDDLFEVRNSPWYAYDIHFGDVVRAIPPNADQKPTFREVVKPSGHKTLRVLFPKETSEAEQAALLDRLSSDGASYERANSRLVAIDVRPAGNYQRVCDRLWEWEQEGVLDYETGTSAQGAEA